MSLVNDLRGVIDKHLPLEVGSLLRERLTLCDTLEGKVKLLDDEVARLKKDRDGHAERAAGFKAKIDEDAKIHGDLVKREQDVSKRELALESTILKTRLEDAVKENEALRNLAMAFSPNAPKTVERVLSSQIPYQYTDQYGHHSGTNFTETRDTTKVT